MALKTPLYQAHLDLGAKMVDFGGWEMPLHYGSQIEEHHAVRRHAGAFDVSHMTVVDVSGSAARSFLQVLLANDVARLTARGKALYTCMLNPDGGVVDDLIAYFLDAENYRLVVNAATREKDLSWIRQQSRDLDVSITERSDLAMLAVQGPRACELVAPSIAAEWREAALALRPFSAIEAGELFIARTGYTGEDGWEVIAPQERAVSLWRQVIEAGVRPSGLGARDTLRLEAGLNLYGTDMDEAHSPLEAGLGWTIAWEPAERNFIGRAAVSAVRKNTNRKKFCGLLLEDKGVLRNHQRVVVDGLADGTITSGGFSPTLERSIALARLPAGKYDRVHVEVRGRLLDARVVKLPFVRNGKAQIEL